jgi:hypothetical protein
MQNYIAFFWSLQMLYRKSSSANLKLEVKVAQEEATKFSDAFVQYAKTNNLNLDTLSEFPVHPAGEEHYMSFS